MKDRRLATRYARALLASLGDARLAEDADRFLAALRDAIRQSSEFHELLHDPAVSRATRQQVLRTLAERASMPAQVVRFLDTVVDHNRAASLASIAEAFHQERDAAAGIVAAEITTACPLGPDLEARAVRALESLTGRKVRLTASLDPTLLGGAVTKVGSTVYDGSLKYQLREIRSRMTQE
jgi:F-type H+-transporting ATPase subunit delta